METEQRGINSALTINGGTRAVRDMLGAIPDCLGRVKDPSDLHVTIVNPDECAVEIFSERDLIVLDNAEAEMHRHLGRLPLGEIVLHPDESRLEKFKRHLAVPIEVSPLIEDLRGAMGDIIRSETGFVLSEKYRPHLSVVRMHRNKKPGRRLHIPVAQNLHVNGYNVGQKVLKHDAARARHRQPYVNHPRART